MAAPAAKRSATASLRAAWSLLTVCGGHSELHRWAPAWYGVVGGVLGALLGGVWWLAGELVPPLVAAVVVVAADAALTGLLHLDGLADSADGLLPPVTRERRLAIMRGPEVGAFGFTVVALTLIARVAALASVAPQPLLLVGLWALSRGAMAATPLVIPYARAEPGLGASLGERRAELAGAIVGAFLGVGALALVGLRGLAAVLGAVLAASAVVALARRRLGGYTGDVLGALGVLAETVGLLVATIS